MQTAVGGKIITFYSYKGGTGRSMLLANVAWQLASSGKKVLTIDWDLEAPGLHRYFEPFLADKTLESSTGVIDFVYEYATAAVSAVAESPTEDWYVPYSNLLGHAVSVDWKFDNGGLLDLVPAGRQDTAYGSRVNSFDWQRFYEKLGGGVLLETVKHRLRQLYDYILIDSRTGVSDTSGVCTVQMPDELVVCFTLNRQSIFGAAAVALSTHLQRKSPNGESTLKVWPVPTRIDYSEKDRLELARALARTRFTSMLRHMNADDEDEYWGEMEIPYNGYYAYEEILSAFGDRPRQSGSLRNKVEALVRALGGDDSFSEMNETRRLDGLSKFTARSASSYIEELTLLGQEYENLRKQMPAGARRTNLMTALVERAWILGGRKDLGRIGQDMFNRDTDGSRIVGLALACGEPQRGHVEMVLQGISASRSAFEQFYALVLAEKVVPLLDPTASRHVQASIQAQIGKTITTDDQGRWSIGRALIQRIDNESTREDWSRPPEIVAHRLDGFDVALAECRPTQAFVRYEDVDENHGPFVVTRGTHSLRLPPAFRMALHLVTNEQFFQFVNAGGYQRKDFWLAGNTSPSRYVTGDGTTLGPASWPSSSQIPEAKELHPVCGICCLEARAFVEWCNSHIPPDSSWRWSLPPEDAWEYAARTEAGLTYPWGDAFDPAKCNSAESLIGQTSEVGRFVDGASRTGCLDMAGNVWEFVHANDSRNDACVLRGGSFTNNRFEIRSYLRLVSVPVVHRPPDFGFRLAQLQVSSPSIGDNVRPPR